MSALSPALDLAWKIAASEAGSAGHPQIAPAHLLVGLCSLEKALGATASETGLTPEALAGIRAERAAVNEVLAGVALDASELRRALRRQVGQGPGAARGPISRDPTCKRAFARAEQAAGGGPVGCLHLLAALLEDPDAATREALADRRVPVEGLLRRARAFAGVGDTPAEKPAELSPAARAALAALQAQAAEATQEPAPAGPPHAEQAGPEAARASGTPMLDRYSRDLTRLAAQGELGPVVGRRQELLQVLQTLARSSKNNPVLVGEAGVGKTAIVEGLAIRAAAGKDPAVLAGKRILELNLGALLGGTDYRGEFEKRLTRILDEARGDPNLIVFIDEIHTVVGAGRVGSGGTDAANILKPALARGELRVIGATTVSEYRRYLESDAALERRFERIEVPEPSAEETLEVLWGLRRKWERHHGVAIEDGALAAAVSLSVRFDPEHRLPDKAVDLVDKAAARARVPMLSMFSPETPAAGPAAALAPASASVGARMVAEVLAEKRGLALDLVLAELGERSGVRLLEVERLLKARLVGQDHAIERVASRLRLAHAGLAARRGPLAVFLFLGPTGVGKTELARLLAEALFGSADQIVRFDMSEYMEEHAVARLLGAPPGYVGHEEEGLLIRQLRSKPHAVVLLDEVEKAHPRLFDVFLQVFEEGRVTGSQGRTADARNAIFVLTSNLGGSGPKPRPGFPGEAETPLQDEAERAALDEAKGFFRAELLNRIDDIIVFRRLAEADVRRIAEIAVRDLVATVRERHGAEIRVEPEALAFVAAAGFSPAFGARELRRTVERLVQVPLAQRVLSGELGRHRVWRLSLDGDQISVRPEAAGEQR
jgi:ATP-dependent Clp protease ATP-binding subunit ClpC